MNDNRAERLLTVGAVLAGGRSTRFGSPKGLAPIGGRPILERVLSAHRQLFEDVVLVAGDSATYQPFGVTTIPDLYPGCGPVAGIHAALTWAAQAGAGGICCTPCDAPFVRTELFDLLLSQTSGAEAVLPCSHGPLGFEPLFGWYSTASLPIFERFLREGGRAAHDLVSHLHTVRYLPLSDIERFAAADLLFLNINTAHDLSAAERYLFDAGAD